MQGRGNQRPGLVAKLLVVLIAAVAIAIVVLGIYGMGNQPRAVRGSQVLPAEAAQQAGERPRPSPQPN